MKYTVKSRNGIFVTKADIKDVNALKQHLSDLLYDLGTGESISLVITKNTKQGDK